MASKIKRILLVDDDDIFLVLGTITIEKLFPEAEIFTVPHGEEALDFLQENDVDIMFLDLNMPILDGWEVLEELAKRERKRMAIFVVTSSIDPSDRQKANSNPLVYDLIEKPLDESNIKSAIKKKLASRSK
ncbi:MAG: response regulator [Cyclobacteriaceae bacterium]